MSSDEGSPPPPRAPPPTLGKSLAGQPSPSPVRDDAIARLDIDYSTSRARGAKSRAPPAADGGVVPSNIRNAAATVTPVRMRLNDPLAINVSSPLAGRAAPPQQVLLDAETLRNRGAVVDPQRGLYRAKVKEVTVRRPDGTKELILTHTRPDGVEVVSREVQTTYTKRHNRLGIVFRGHSVSKLVVFISFCAPILVILSMISFYVNWRPQFHIWNGTARGNAAGENPPTWLLFLAAANVFYFFMTYFCVLPLAYKCLTTDDEVNARRDVVATAFAFILAFLPVWVGEFGVTTEIEYTTAHDGMWASYLVQILGGLCWYGVVWYIYSTHMAEVMHAKAQAAADEYLRAIQHGYYYRRMKQARAKGTLLRNFMPAAWGSGGGGRGKSAALRRSASGDGMPAPASNTPQGNAVDVDGANVVADAFSEANAATTVQPTQTQSHVPAVNDGNEVLLRVSPQPEEIRQRANVDAAGRSPAYRPEVASVGV